MKHDEILQEKIEIINLEMKRSSMHLRRSTDDQVKAASDEIERLKKDNQLQINELSQNHQQELIAIQRTYHTDLSKHKQEMQDALAAEISKVLEE